MNITLEPILGISILIIAFIILFKQVKQGQNTIKREEKFKDNEVIIIETKNIKISNHLLMGKLNATLTNFRLFIKKEKNDSILYILNLKKNVHTESTTHQIRNISSDSYNFIYSKKGVTLKVTIKNQEEDYEYTVHTDQLSPLQSNQLKKYYF
ncbi:MAG: hypothetical protein D3919_08055 [Candidatus Electrothrix sp. AW5]|nr:hypothetical protein [Candidatus Electrothrix gigas]MCI5196168.1 hypothetical protein [Candidatus Electrothrix gigas]